MLLKGKDGFRSNAKNAYDLLADIARLAKREPQAIAMRFILAKGNALKNAIRRLFPTAPANSCGAVGCVAGWAIQLTGHHGATDAVVCSRTSDWSSGLTSDYLADARTILGLDYGQSDELFTPGWYCSGDQMTPAHAARVVEHIHSFMKKYESQLKAHSIG